MNGWEYLALMTLVSGSTVLFGAIVYYLARPSSR
jgi:hypothetical protein